MYLFADRIVARDTPWTVGTKVPCTATKVRHNALAETMFAVAFFTLRRDGSVRLAATHTKVVFRQRPDVIVDPLAAAQRSGLEGAALASLTVAGEDRVSEVIRRWFGKQVESPWHDVILVGVEEAAALGYLAPVGAGRGGAGQKLVGRDGLLEPVCQRITELAASFEDLAARWHRFERQEPELHGALCQACRRGIRSRWDTSGGGG